MKISGTQEMSTPVIEMPHAKCNPRLVLSMLAVAEEAWLGIAGS
jgi:hypothetical protein